MDDHTAGSRKLLVTDMAFEVFSLLMLNQYLLVIEFSIAIVAPYLRRNSLLLLPHNQNNNRASLNANPETNRVVPKAQDYGGGETRTGENQTSREQEDLGFCSWPFPIWEGGFRLSHADLRFYPLPPIFDFSLSNFFFPFSMASLFIIYIVYTIPYTYR